MKRTLWFLDWTTRACCYLGALSFVFHSLYDVFYQRDWWKVGVSGVCIVCLMHFATFVKQEPSQ